MKNNELVEYAIVDHMHVMINELFKSSPKNKKAERFQIKQEYGNYKIEIRAFSQLDAFDLTFLQTVIGLAGADQKIIDQDSKGTKSKELRKGMELKHDAMFQESLVVTIGYRELARQMGKTCSGGFIKRIKESLKDISSTKFFIEQKDNSSLFGFNISSYILSTDKELTISLNPFLASAIFGSRNFTKVFLTEARKIKIEAGKILHTKLSSLIEIGSEKTFKIETLCEYMWKGTEVSVEAQRKRKQKLIKILKELEKLNWEYAEGKKTIKIKRPYASKMCKDE